MNHPDRVVIQFNPSPPEPNRKQQQTTTKTFQTVRSDRLKAAFVPETSLPRGVQVFHLFSNSSDTHTILKKVRSRHPNADQASKLGAMTRAMSHEGQQDWAFLHFLYRTGTEERSTTIVLDSTFPSYLPC